MIAANTVKSKKWQCPKCGFVYINPLPIVGAVCRAERKDHARGGVEMKPVLV